ncbi:ATP-dependent DNA helicase Q1 [Plutella xylostella]|uniref:ATP-dependent DNA helicase Q1 n=1 Tax=Plutella xylostella TaxID=51655 RepID=UPI0020323B5C|nr:ATP-dependent DNA helicase Q1 [Plutella xylostella]
MTEMKTADDYQLAITNIDKELVKVEAEITKWKTIQRKLNEKKTSYKNAITKLKSDSLASLDWEGTSYEWSDDVKSTLENIFKIKSFRPKQLSAINSTLSGEHAIVVMPTGAGKSLCYQLPALLRPGLTVVVSPLISLMEDQIRSLTQKNIPAMLMCSTSSKDENQTALKTLTDDKTDIKLLYVTPERFAKSKRFMSNLQKCHAAGRLQRFAIDEVHCCSQWGHDFRPDYKFLGILSNMFPKVPILGLTGTATSHVLSDVQKILNIPGCLVLKTTFNRPNLFYQILEKPATQEGCLDVLEKLLKYRYKDESGIIYAHSIKDCEDLAQGLRKRGLRVGCYHASLDAETRSKVHQKWHEKIYQAIVATVAFGMGIDKPDVRFVIHHSISKTMENYYQESGRAGRDGLRAECVTLYRMQDLFRVSTMVFSNNGHLEQLYGMIKYCLNVKVCRRQVVAEYFNENWGNTDCNYMCDVCIHPNKIIREIRLEEHIKNLAVVIEKAEKKEIKLTALKLLDAWFLKGPVNIRHDGPDPGLKISRLVGEDVIAYLLIKGYLVEDFHFTAMSTISYIKCGPNMEMIKDENFSLRMLVRKSSAFNLEEPAPCFVPACEEVFEEGRGRSKRNINDVNEQPPEKTSKSEAAAKKPKKAINDESKPAAIAKKPRQVTEEKCKPKPEQDTEKRKKHPLNKPLASEVVIVDDDNDDFFW